MKSSLKAPINIGPQINRYGERTHFLLRFIGVWENKVSLNFKVGVQTVAHALEHNIKLFSEMSCESSHAELENSVNAGRLLQSASVIPQEC